MSDAVIDAWGVDETQHAIVESYVTDMPGAPLDVRWVRRGRRVLLECWSHRRTECVGAGRYVVDAEAGLFGRTYPSLESAKAAVGFFSECGVVRSLSR